MGIVNLHEMYAMQKEFDARVIKEKGLEGKDLLPETVLALQVEIGELANEWRGFKYWSDDRKPRTHVWAHDTFDAKEPHRRKGVYRNALLEEYVDCLAMFLSIANQLDLPADDLYSYPVDLEGDPSSYFTELLYDVGMINGNSFMKIDLIPNVFNDHRRHSFKAAIGLFYDIGEQILGFGFEEIAEAYVAKNKINHERQANGY